MFASIISNITDFIVSIYNKLCCVIIKMCSINFECNII